MRSRATQIRETGALRDPWQRCLEAINRLDGVGGSLLITRDGLCVLNECSRLRKPEVVSAMAAAILAASETVSTELGMTGPARFQIQAGRHTLLGVGATETLLVLALFDQSLDAAAITADVERLAFAAASATPW